MEEDWLTVPGDYMNDYPREELQYPRTPTHSSPYSQPTVTTEEPSPYQRHRSIDEVKPTKWASIFCTLLILILGIATVAIVGLAYTDAQIIKNYVVAIFDVLQPVEPKALPQCCFIEGDPDCDDSVDCAADFVIAGCGSAGALMASLLSDPNNAYGKSFSVVCLEEGDYHNDDNIVQYAVLNGVSQTLMVSGYAAYSGKMQTNVEPVIPNYYPLAWWGGMFGGTGNHDGTMSVQPSPMRVQELVGMTDSTWSFTAQQALMNNIEVYAGPAPPPGCTVPLDGAVTVTNVDGNTNTSSVNYRMLQLMIPNSPVDLAASAVSEAPNYNCGVELSASSKVQYFQQVVNATNTLRTSSALNYMGPTVMTPSGYGLGERKLRVLYGSTVDKFEMDDDLRATNFDVVVKGLSKKVYAKKQLVIAGNALFTPGIIERSGVGNANILAQFDIPTRVSSPKVGENLQTHIGSLFMISTNDSVAFNQQGLTGQALLSILDEYGGERAVQFLQIPFPTVTGSGGNLAGDLVGVYDLSPGYNAITTLISNLVPVSRGNVHISGTDPTKFPSVNFNLYTDPTKRDLRSIVGALQVMYNVTLNLRTLNPGLDYQILMPPEIYFASESRLEEYVLHSPFIQYHYSSTASMGAVLTNQLSLIGVDGVTVADTSSWPIINNGNTREQAFRTAAYAADYLLQNTPV